jgi:hypothetical protein
MKMKKTQIIATTALVALIMAISTGAANAQSSSQDDDGIVFAPYLWMAALDGTSTIGGLPPLDIDASFSDIFSNLDFGAAFHTEFRKGPWAFVIDPMYLSIEADLAPGGVTLPDGANPKLSVDMWFVELWAGYEFADHWEVLGGARYQSQDIDITGLPVPPLPFDSLSVSDDWTDWFIGLRFMTDMSEKWFVTARLDAVVAGDSSSSTNAMVMFNRRFGENKALNLGYRYFVDDYDNLPSYAWDMTQDGPVVGFTWVF